MKFSKVAKRSLGCLFPHRRSEKFGIRIGLAVVILLTVLLFVACTPQELPVESPLPQSPAPEIAPMVIAITPIPAALPIAAPTVAPTNTPGPAVHFTMPDESVYGTLIDDVLYFPADDAVSALGYAVFLRADNGTIMLNGMDGSAHELSADLFTSVAGKPYISADKLCALQNGSLFVAPDDPNQPESDTVAPLRNGNGDFELPRLSRNPAAQNVLSVCANRNYNPANFLRYVAYLAEHSVAFADAVTYVNCNADLEPYSRVEILDDPHNVLALFDKFHKAPDDFVPVMKKIDGERWVKEAGEAWLKMKAAARKDGVTLRISSTYRSIASQAEIFQRRSRQYSDPALASLYHSRPGHSEHHTGYAADLSPVTKFTGSKADNWIRENAHYYGFIISYTDENSFITRYNAEPWHLRWFPQDVADIMWREKLTLAEYLDLYVTETGYTLLCGLPVGV